MRKITNSDGLVIAATALLGLILVWSSWANWFDGRDKAFRRCPRCQWTECPREATRCRKCFADIPQALLQEETR
jgi:hypothetical protein